MNVDDVLDFDGPPRRWISRGGRPAECMGPRGWPSYTHDSGLVILDMLVAFMPGETPPKLLSRSYGLISALSINGAPRLHNRPGIPIAMIQKVDGETFSFMYDGPAYEWRPQIYMRMALGWNTLGSQHELMWRYSLGMVQRKQWIAERPDLEERILEDGPLIDTFASEDRAKELLESELTPLQHCELVAESKFRVRGGATGRVYKVDIDNGFNLVDDLLGETTVSYCLHTEEWLPGCDQALAIKLALEDDELELDFVAAAKATRYPFRAGRPADTEAAALEQWIVGAERKLIHA